MTDITRYEAPIETVHAETIPNTPEQPRVTFTVNPKAVAFIAGVVTVGLIWYNSTKKDGREEKQ